MNEKDIFDSVGGGRAVVVRGLRKKQCAENPPVEQAARGETRIIWRKRK